MAADAGPSPECHSLRLLRNHSSSLRSCDRRRDAPSFCCQRDEINHSESNHRPCVVAPQPQGIDQRCLNVENCEVALVERRPSKMRVSQPADLTADSLLTSEGLVVLHDHVEVRADKPQWGAVEIEQCIEIRPLSVCQVHKHRAVPIEQFANLGDYPGLPRRVYFIHDLDSFLRRRNTNRSAPQFSVLQITISI